VKRRCDVVVGSPMARDVERALAAFRTGDVGRTDTAYRAAAVKAARSDLGLWACLAMQHVAQLLDLGALTPALQRCNEYLDPQAVACPDGRQSTQPDVAPLSAADRVELRLLRAEIYSAAGAHARAEAEATVVRNGAVTVGSPLDDLDRARLLRVEGLAAADAGRARQAFDLLSAASEGYRAAGSVGGVAAADRALRAVRLRAGGEDGTGPLSIADAAPVAGAAPRASAKVADLLEQVAGLRLQVRYQEALDLVSGLRPEDVDPALRFAVLGVRSDLLRLTEQHTLADELADDLVVASASTLDPDRSLRSLIWQGSLPSVADAAAGPLVEGLQAAIRLIRVAEATPAPDRRRGLAGELLGEAEALLHSLHDRAAGPRDLALWHLLAGDLEQVRWRTNHRGSALTATPEASPESLPASPLDTAIEHLTLAAELTDAGPDGRLTSSAEIRVRALRAWGHLEVARREYQGDPCRARGLVPPEVLDRWREARELEEQIALRQPGDAFRLRMLASASTEFDEQVLAAQDEQWQAAHSLTVAVPPRTGAGPRNGSGASAVAEVLGAAAAGVVRAMDAPRGTTFLALLGTAPGGPVRQRARVNRGRPDDADSAERWLRRTACDLPRSQAVWLLYATRDVLHHALVGRGGFVHLTHQVVRSEIGEAVRRLGALADDPERAAAHQEFEDAADDLAHRLGLNGVLRQLPSTVDRLAILAGGVLADVPFPALRETRDDEPLGLRYALSDLPCLPARRPLHRRSRCRRGDRVLLVHPPTDLRKSRPAPVTDRRFRVLDEERATLDELRTALTRWRPNVVRIDTHGKFDQEAGQAWIQLAPSGSEGRLTPQTLRDLDLSSCGTLVLGACETGLGDRLGRREEHRGRRRGEDDECGRDERDGFVRAGFDAGAAAIVAARWKAEDATADDVLNTFLRLLPRQPRDVALRQALRGVGGQHPARWACWTVYGDSGCQTRAAAVRSWLRRWTRDFEP
jgi:hypothetical protein